jgi:hypothetical protein
MLIDYDQDKIIFGCWWCGYGSLKEEYFEWHSKFEVLVEWSLENFLFFPSFSPCSLKELLQTRWWWDPFFYGMRRDRRKRKIRIEFSFVITFLSWQSLSTKKGEWGSIMVWNVGVTMYGVLLMWIWCEGTIHSRGIETLFVLFHAFDGIVMDTSCRLESRNGIGVSK